ncbi:ribonuclease T2 family protein [Rhizobium halophytocola]|uniref:Ribonuclease T2 n=1 Tax=Rhizobium halophytocola TaxID=735519 RepID=A0ABS4DYG1_9HYPH|nr:ribonuclease [Rhizobium halophytocola]MBP1850722.1 ribonuclease T2 [Rhizobium halophytocola]
MMSNLVRHLARYPVLLLVALLAFFAAPQGSRAEPAAGEFDFYVLSLSWSPTYCRTPQGRNNRQQCSAARRYGMVLHGLWPQYERGYPESCPSTEPERVDRALGNRYLDIMPGMGLIGHEWRKHGTCSGLNQADYFATARKAFSRVRIPEQMKSPASTKRFTPQVVEALFSKANPGLGHRAMAVTCQGEMLQDVRICLTKDLRFRDCRQVDADACRRSFVILPPAP